MAKILVFGDSIAYGKWDSEGGWVARLRKYIDENHNIGKGGNFQVYNLGIPGEVAPRLLERFESELQYRIHTEEENLVIIAVGVNDSCPNNWMTKVKTPMHDFQQALRGMIEIAAEYQCKVLFVGLAPVNPAKSKGLQFSNESVAEYDEYISEVCAEESIPKVEVFEALMEQNFPDLLEDSVHPGSHGHELLCGMVKEALLAQGYLD